MSIYSPKLDLPCARLVYVTASWRALHTYVRWNSVYMYIPLEARSIAPAHRCIARIIVYPYSLITIVAIYCGEACPTIVLYATARIPATRSLGNCFATYVIISWTRGEKKVARRQGNTRFARVILFLSCVRLAHFTLFIFICLRYAILPRKMHSSPPFSPWRAAHISE